MVKKIIITGDIHAEWHYLNALINKKRPEIVICCGDFGFWPEKYYTIRKYTSRGEEIRQTRLLWPGGHIKNGNTKVYFCDGNHEDHWTLLELTVNHGRYPIKVEPNVFYCPRGTILEIDGFYYLFFGGADSIDKPHRRLGFDWYPEEKPSYGDLDYTLKAVEKHHATGKQIHAVISHTVPMSVLPKELQKKMIWSHNYVDPTWNALELIFEKARPAYWYFGHWHTFLQKKVDNCYFNGLNMAGNSGWWIRHKPVFSPSLVKNPINQTMHLA